MSSTFDPTGKSFNQRLNAFLEDVKNNYSINIKQDSGRTPAWQQKHHVAHMFLYNAYKSTKPKYCALGQRTISWSHLSDAKVNWKEVSFKDFLRTKTNSIPAKQGNQWQQGFEPDLDATKKNVKSMLINAGIGNSGKAMVSAGLKPCAEPCLCNAGRSKHLDGIAADLNTGQLQLLSNKLSASNKYSLDEYLKKFGLHRPLLNHPSSPESWHIEADK